MKKVLFIAMALSGGLLAYGPTTGDKEQTKMERKLWIAMVLSGTIQQYRPTHLQIQRWVNTDQIFPQKTAQNEICFVGFLLYFLPVVTAKR